MRVRWNANWKNWVIVCIVSPNMACIPGSGGKCYDWIYQHGISWDACKSKADSYASDNNIPATSWIATINSLEEKNFINNLPNRPTLQNNQYMFVGGNRRHHAPARRYQWTEGPDGYVDAGIGVASSGDPCSGLASGLYCDWDTGVCLSILWSNILKGTQRLE